MMRTFLNSICILILCTTSFYSTTTAQDLSVTTSTAIAERYLVTLSEFQLPDAATPSLTADEITSQIAAKKLLPIETIRVAIVDGIEGMAQFGKQVAVTTGTTGNRDSKTRQTRDVPIGTIIRVTSKSNGSEIVLSIQYESSRLNGNGTDDSAPDILTNRITTTQAISLSKPTLLGGTSKDQSSYAILTLTKLPQKSH